MTDRPTRTPSVSGTAMSGFVLILFFGSGAAALIYEVSWVRALTLQFGSTSLAVSTVLTLFMGGLALGAWVAGRHADHTMSPLTTYGLIEIAVALYALITPVLFPLAIPIFEWTGSTISHDLWAVSLVRFAIAAVLLLPPTALMGATLPVLSRHHVVRGGEGRRGAAWLYGVNTLGAFVGTVCAGFLLLPTLGLTRTVVVTAVGNLVLGLAALVAGRRTERRRESTPQGVAAVTEAMRSDDHPDPSMSSAGTVMLAVAFTGFAAMASEVAWTRLLTLVLGGSIFAFTVMLSTFLAGLGLGATIVAAVLRSSPGAARRLFFFLAVFATQTLVLSTATFQHLPDLFRQLYWTWNLESNPEAILRLQSLVAALVMFVPALLMGGLLPAAMGIVVGRNDQAGRQVGMLYAANVIGSVVGSFMAGFAMIPLVGVRGSLLVAATLQCGAAVLVIGSEPPRLRRAFQAAAAVVWVSVLLLAPGWNPQVMASGMYQYAASFERLGLYDLETTLEQREELLFYRDGLTATVTVARDLRSRDRDLYISTNGKIDGSSYFDMPTQRLSAHVPILAHAAPRNVCVIGMGTGCTAGSAALHDSVDQVTVVEIEPAMVEGARLFRNHNHAVHENPKVDIQTTAGRLFLRMHPGEFDVVISEPSNPWLAGSSDLFTTDFFRLGARALREDGLFCQWLQLYGLSPDNLRTVVRSFHEVFPYTYVISTITDSDTLLLGSRNPIALDPARAMQRMQQEAVAADLADPRVRIFGFHELAARFRMGPREIAAFVGPGPLHTDDLPLIAYNAPKDLYRDTRSLNMELLARHAVGLGPYVDEPLEPGPTARRFLQELAAAYRAFLPGGNEAVVAERLASQ